MRNRRVILVLAGLFGVCGMVFGVLLSMTDLSPLHEVTTSKLKLAVEDDGPPRFVRTLRDDNTADCLYRWQSFEQNRAADLQIERMRKIGRMQQFAGREFKPTPNGPEHEITIPIDLNQKEKLSAAFGAPDNITEYDLYQDQRHTKSYAEKISLLAERGFRFNEAEFRFEIVYPWVVSKSAKHLTSAAQMFQQLAQQNNYHSHRGLLSFVASFIQAIEYIDTVPKHFEHEKRTYRTGGMTMPLETLLEGKGDCDTKAVLFAALMAHVPRTHIIFLNRLQGNEGHVLVGVRGVPRRNDQKFTIQGADYIVLEMNHPWPVGQIPKQHAQAIRHFTHETVYPN